ncbi:hypothetical protein CYMTET_54576 [Cymbomonas tetramitiformis]|uniref:SGNH hydrolase-type esterase domain-containing protein n=1 Tax=Cymbomonas tetramitiformis TaxID=36881 RepID=A0AAE0ENV8_9CHLO|nr:hypothetical protein CYMTET_54576 [Cymbomonas tetramitiformis]
MAKTSTEPRDFCRRVVFGLFFGCVTLVLVKNLDSHRLPPQPSEKQDVQVPATIIANEEPAQLQLLQSVSNHNADVSPAAPFAAYPADAEKSEYWYFGNEHICTHVACTPSAGKRPHQVKLHQQYKQDAARLSKKVDVVFLGDSITEAVRGTMQGKPRSPQLKVTWGREKYYKRSLVLGIAHEETQHVLWRIQDGALRSLSPKVVVLLIGTNNFAVSKNLANETAEGIVAVVEATRRALPRARILLVSIFPRGSLCTTSGCPLKFDDLVQETNRLTAEYVDRVGKPQYRQMRHRNEWTACPFTVAKQNHFSSDVHGWTFVLRIDEPA